MSALRLILLLLLVVVAVAVVVLVLRRGSAKRDAQRVEAAGLRSDADAIAATMPGQAAFADQAEQRAEQARLEAEEKAREAQRLQSEAAEHRAAAAAAQHDYETTMRRADDIDPDVKESTFAPVPEAGAEGEPGTAVSGSSDAAPAPAATATPVAVGDEGHPEGDTDGEVAMTRAERREAREAQESGEIPAVAPAPPAPSAASSAATAGAAGAAAAGASAWASRGDEDPGDGEREDESERIASAADFRDDEPAQDDAGDEVYHEPTAGSEANMSDQTRTESSDDTTHDDGLGGSSAAATAAAGAGGGYAATRAMHEEADQEPTDPADPADPAEPAADVAHDVESPRGEWGGPHDKGAGDRAEASEAGEMTVIGDPEAYAATEPVMAADQTPPVSPQDADGSHAADEHEQHDQGSTDHAPAEAGAAVAETDDTGRSASDVAEEPTQDRYDPTPTRDWAADEGELLDETHDRGERLEAERAELATEGDDAAPVTAPEARDDQTPGTAAEARDDDTAVPAAEETSHDGDAPEQAAGRRISGFDELRDGGYGVGSAAPLDDRAQPLDHPVQADRDSMTYRVPGDAGYDSSEPHVWFYDEGAAERSGFRRADG